MLIDKHVTLIKFNEHLFDYIIVIRISLFFQSFIHRNKLNIYSWKMKLPYKRAKIWLIVKRNKKNFTKWNSMENQISVKTIRLPSKNIKVRRSCHWLKRDNRLYRWDPNDIYIYIYIYTHTHFSLLSQPQRAQIDGNFWAATIAILWYCEKCNSSTCSGHSNPLCHVKRE